MGALGPDEDGVRHVFAVDLQAELDLRGIRIGGELDVPLCSLSAARWGPPFQARDSCPRLVPSRKFHPATPWRGDNSSSVVNLLGEYALARTRPMFKVRRRGRRNHEKKSESGVA